MCSRRRENKFKTGHKKLCHSDLGLDDTVGGTLINDKTKLIINHFCQFLDFFLH